jgi:DNA-binding GntR family transcriptional regulator
MLPPIKSQKISDIIYNLLKEKIVSKEFPPGSRLDLTDIEIQLEVSRTPLKEALNRLEMDGLVNIMPRYGTFVTDPTIRDISDSFDLRELLEIYAIEIATKNATDQDIENMKEIVEEMGQKASSNDKSSAYPYYLELDNLFHKNIVALCGNKRLIEVHSRENLHSQMARVRFRRIEEELLLTQKEHEQILSALEQRDISASIKELKNHLDRAKHSLLEDMRTAYSISTTR